MDAGVGVDEDAFGGTPLPAVAGDPVALVEMTMLTRVELDLAAVIEAGENATFGQSRFDHSHVPIGDADRCIGRGKLNAVTENSRSICW